MRLANNSPGTPLFSIVTASRNAVNLLPLTWRSLAAQNFRDFEWLVVDGASTDGSAEWLAAADGISYWRSEPDEGIYDAWNKACALASGEWIIFLGAGDVLAGPDVLAEMARHLRQACPEHPLVYGRLRLLSPGERCPLEEMGRPWKEIQNHWEIGRPALPPHGATFHHRSILKDSRPFDTRYRIAADSKFLLENICRAEPLYVDMVVACAPMGGVSFKLQTAAALASEIRAINRELGIRPSLGKRLTETMRLAAIGVLCTFPERTSRKLADLLRRLTGQSPRWSVR